MQVRFYLEMDLKFIYLSNFAITNSFYEMHAVHHPQNSQQKSVPDLNVLTVAFLALKKMFFLKKKFFPKKIFFFTFFQCNFSVRTLQCFQFFFAHEKLKKTPKNDAQNWPRPLFPTVQPRSQPTAQN